MTIRHRRPYAHLRDICLTCAAILFTLAVAVAGLLNGNIAP
jgi:hypothetical protein